ncbi:hypothetical protein LDB17_07070 [Dysgonomonas sp. Shenzhen-Wh21]|uniref:hypothetical protein n=1 Tax=Dysgonomonas sp. Shenzhen-Wh21 TaxID=2878548 RepID=UPI00372CECC5
MYKVYFKQALGMLKQNKFISIITITGTALRMPDLKSSSVNGFPSRKVKDSTFQ